jgi:hypothetical protein
VRSMWKISNPRPHVIASRQTPKRLVPALPPARAITPVAGVDVVVESALLLALKG